MNNAKTKTWPWIVATAAATLLASASMQATFAKAASESVPGACKQWQTGSPLPVIDLNGALPEVDKPHADTAPEGWEPFALGYGGRVVYKRCVK